MDKYSSWIKLVSYAINDILADDEDPPRIRSLRLLAELKSLYEEYPDE